MKTATEPAWRTVAGLAQPPKDRPIKIVANIVDCDEWSTSVDPYEGFAQWSEAAQDWLNEAGLSIRGFYESELVILEWTEGNPDRRFQLKRRWNDEDRVRRIAPMRPRLALPPPAWLIDPHHPHNSRKVLSTIPDAEIEARRKSVDQFWSCLLTTDRDRQHLWTDFGDALRAVERAVNDEIAERWLGARCKKRNRTKKARVA